MKTRLWMLVLFLALLLNSFGIWNYLSFGTGLGWARFYSVFNFTLILFCFCGSLSVIQDELNSKR